MNHLDRVHQCRQCINDGLRRTSVEWLDELFKSSQVLDIVLCFIQILGYFDLEILPFLSGEVDFVFGLVKFSCVFRDLLKVLIDKPAVFRSHFFKDAGKLLHPLPPKLEFGTWPWITTFYLLVVRLLKKE